MRGRIQAAGLLAFLAAVGCGTEQRDSDREAGGPRTGTLAVWDGLPELTCGLQYVTDQSTVEGLGCNGVTTYSTAYTTPQHVVPMYQAPNQQYYRGVWDGDVARAPFGFVHQDQFSR